MARENSGAQQTKPPPPRADGETATDELQVRKKPSAAISKTVPKQPGRQTIAKKRTASKEVSEPPKKQKARIEPPDTNSNPPDAKTPFKTSILAAPESECSKIVAIQMDRIAPHDLASHLDKLKAVLSSVEDRLQEEQGSLSRTRQNRHRQEGKALKYGIKAEKCSRGLFFAEGEKKSYSAQAEQTAICEANIVEHIARLELDAADVRVLVTETEAQLAASTRESRNDLRGAKSPAQGGLAASIRTQSTSKATTLDPFVNPRDLWEPASLRDPPPSTFPALTPSSCIEVESLHTGNHHDLLEIPPLQGPGMASRNPSTVQSPEPHDEEIDAEHDPW